MTKTYTQQRICRSCGFNNSRELDKRTAAFESTQNWIEKCPKCGKNEIESGSCDIPNLDSELLDIWGKDENLWFLDQDEDLLLANDEDIPLLLSGIDNRDLLLSKRTVLFSALCVLIYDHFHEEDAVRGKDTKSIKQLIHDLRARSELIQELNTDSVSDYIQKVVFPELSLSRT